MIIADRIHYEYMPTAEEAPVGHGEYPDIALDLHDVFGEVDLNINNLGLYEDLHEMLLQHHHPILRWIWLGYGEDDLLTDGWRQFQHFVRKERRFTFLAPQTQSSLASQSLVSIPLEEVPNSLSQAIKKLHLAKTMPARTIWWRARAHEAEESWNTAKELGVPHITLRETTGWHLRESPCSADPPMRPEP